MGASTPEGGVYENKIDKDFFKAGVVELVDTLDLGSSDSLSWGFKSLRPHQVVKFED